ncbi:hypothetical protein Prudu_001880, partial [Prunus dulcis]
LPRNLGRATLRLPSDGPATTGRADLRRGYHRSASVSPSQPDQPPLRGRPELAGKSCFPAEVRPKLPKLPARNSPSFLHQIDRVRHQEPDRIAKETFEGPLKYAGSTTGPFKASASPRKVENSGIGQNTGETLPNFRQQSK